MVLGRTDKGLIKIKTDEEGGGLRAVNCACCNSCGCATAISGDLVKTLDEATTGTCNGQNPYIWNVIPASEGVEPGWYAAWFFSEIYTLRWFSDTKCLHLSGDNAINLIDSGNCEDCKYPDSYACIDVEYIINGTSFPAMSTILDNDFPSVPSPVFVLT